MEVHLTPDQEAHLVRIATNAGTDRQHLLREIVLQLLEDDSRFQAVLDSVDAALRLVVPMPGLPGGMPARDFVVETVNASVSEFLILSVYTCS